MLQMSVFGQLINSSTSADTPVLMIAPQKHFSLVRSACMAHVSGNNA